VFFFVWQHFVCSAACLPRWRSVGFIFFGLLSHGIFPWFWQKLASVLSLFGGTGRCLGALLFIYVGEDRQFGVVRCCFGRGRVDDGAVRWRPSRAELGRLVEMRVV
jgi:hypothetical protein